MEEQQSSGSPPDRQNTQPPTSGIGLWVSYDIGIWTRLRTFAESAGRFLRIMQPPPNQGEIGPFVEFGDLDKGTRFKDIDSFCTSLQNTYLLISTQKIDRERWKVTRVSTYKDTNNGVKHEYLLATMKCGKLEIYMRIERRVHKSAIGNLVGASGSLGPPAGTVACDGSDPAPEVGSPSNAPPRKKFSKIASDEVTFSKDLTMLGIGSDTEVDVIDFKDNKISLPRLAILVHCVNTIASEYHILSQNCYWFAQVIAEALKELDPNHVVFAPRDAGKRAAWGLFPVHLFFKNSKEMATKVVEIFKVQWEKFVKDIDDTINNPDSPPAQDERRKRSEAEQQLDAARSHLAEKDKEIKRLKEANNRMAEKVEEIERLGAQSTAGL